MPAARILEVMSAQLQTSDCGPAGGYEIRDGRLVTNTIPGDLNGVPLKLVPTPPALTRALAQMRAALRTRCPPRLIVVDNLAGKLAMHITPALLLVSEQEARQLALRLLQVIHRAAVAQLLGPQVPRDPIGLADAVRDEFLADAVAYIYSGMSWLAGSSRTPSYSGSDAHRAVERLAGKVDSHRGASSVLGVLLRLLTLDAVELEPRLVAYLQGYLRESHPERSLIAQAHCSRSLRRPRDARTCVAPRQSRVIG
jgi:hypothetical protein